LLRAVDRLTRRFGEGTIVPVTLLRSPDDTEE
jgi:hypothetical protein